MNNNQIRCVRCKKLRNKETIDIKHNICSVCIEKAQEEVYAERFQNLFTIK